jgi:disulfide bond formation protein DsbB
VGLVNGVLAGLTGLPGFVITIWCQLRGWAKDLQRAVFQPVMLAAIIINVISLSFAGAFTSDIVKLYLFGLPAMLAGIWVGFKFVWKARRHRVPQADAAAFVGVRAGADRSTRMAPYGIRHLTAFALGIGLGRWRNWPDK